MKKTLISSLVLAGLMASFNPLSAGISKQPSSFMRDIVPIAINHQPDVDLQISIKDDEYVYKAGETMSFNVTADEDGYITIWDVGTSGDVTRIFPNEFSPDNMMVIAGNDESIGGESTGFEFKVRGPEGINDVYVLWTEEASTQPQKPKFNSTSEFSKDLSVVARNDRQAWASAKTSFDIIDSDHDDAEYESNGSAIFDFKGNVYVVAMGSNVGELTQTNDDARLFAEAMESSFSKARVKTQLFEDVTKREFVGALKDLRHKVNKDDLVIVYYSGHGVLVNDDNGDEASGQDAAFIPYDVETGEFSDRTIIRDDQYASLINAIGTKNIISVIDACYSGAMQKSILKGRVKYYTPPKRKTKDGYGLVTNNAGADSVVDDVKGLVLAAADKDELAIETFVGALYTLALLDSLSMADIGDDLMDVFKETQSLVAEHSDDEQNPISVGNRHLATGLNLVSNNRSVASLSDF